MAFFFLYIIWLFMYNPIRYMADTTPFTTKQDN